MCRGEVITNLATLSPEEGLRVNYRRNSRESTSQDTNILVRVIQTQKKTTKTCVVRDKNWEE